MIPYIHESIRCKIDFVPGDVIVKEGIVLTPEEQKHFDSLREALKKYGRGSIVSKHSK